MANLDNNEIFDRLKNGSGIKCCSCKNFNLHVCHIRQWKWLQCDIGHWQDEPNQSYSNCKDYKPGYIDIR